jgi:adenylate cyclase
MGDLPAAQARWPELQRVRRAIVVVDVVESVRLMRVDENLFISRWRAFVQAARDGPIATHGGRLVKHLGDGMLLEFAEVPSALAATRALLHDIAAYNIGVAPEIALALRAGIHVAEIVVDELDIFGVGVNLAARLATLAQPGGIVLSIEARDQLTDGLDAQIDDLGHVFVKHIEEPLRAFRIIDAAPRSQAQAPPPSQQALLPAVAVVPFTSPDTPEHASALGHALADGINGGLTQCKTLRLITRQSTSAMAHPRYSPRDVHRHLGAAYVLAGTVQAAGDVATVSAELSNGRTGHVLWAQRYVTSVADVFAGASKAVADIVAHMARSVDASELGQALSMPMPNLEAYTLYLGGQTLLHRLGPRDFGLAHELLEHLSERHPRAAAPRAMLAKWHVLRVVQGLSADNRHDAMQAQFQARRALELNPTEAFSLAAVGMVAAHFEQDQEAAARYYAGAVAANPHEPFAWALRSGAHVYLDEPAQAVDSAERSLALSPLDPMRFMLESYAAMAHIGQGNYARAVALAAASVRRNAVHLPSHKLHVIALALDGQGAQSRGAAQRLLQMEPGLTVQRYVRGFPAPASKVVHTMADALRDAGIPN